MRIILAKTSGFCMGVRRAVDLAVDNAEGSAHKIYTLGPLIHNDQTLEMLNSLGVEVLDQQNPWTEGTAPAVLIRAHGIPPDMERQYSSRGYAIIDGTCPKVKAVHKVIRKYRDMGFAIVITGDEGHAEVTGLLGYAGEAGHLIQSVDDVDKLPPFDKICLVSQTTFDEAAFQAIARRIKDRFSNGGTEVVVRKTICSATRRRQEETRKLASVVDAMIVVGGKHSANTRRLAEIARMNTSHTQHIETERELDWQPLADAKTIGITAGASTPNWMIKRVVEHLQFLDQTRGKTARNVFWRLLEALANLNVFVASGAVAMFYASCYFQGFSFSWRGATLSFGYMVSMYLWNSLASVDTNRHLGMIRYQFYHSHKGWLYLLTLICIGLLLLMSYTENLPLFHLMLFSTAAGIVYHVNIVPKKLQKLVKYTKIKNIPTSRDLFVALAWGVLITFIPQAMNRTFWLTPTSLFFFSWVFCLAYLRSLIFDLRDIEGDRIMGRETLVTILGEKGVRRYIVAALWVSLAVILCFAAISVYRTEFEPDSRAVAFLFQIPVLFYVWCFMRWSQRTTSNRAALFNLFADGQFYVAGMGAFLASMIGL